MAVSSHRPTYSVQINRDKQIQVRQKYYHATLHGLRYCAAFKTISYRLASTQTVLSERSGRIHRLQKRRFRPERVLVRNHRHSTSASSMVGQNGGTWNLSDVAGEYLAVIEVGSLQIRVPAFPSATGHRRRSERRVNVIALRPTQPAKRPPTSQ